MNQSTPNNLPPATKKKFLAVEMDKAILNKYYPYDAQDPIKSVFNHFVFQQVIEDINKNDIDISLIAYAIHTNGEIIGNYLSLTPLNTDTHEAPKRIHFANIYVYPNDLDDIFQGKSGNLRLIPIKSNYHHHIAYEIECNNCVTSKPIDPSPPARSRISTFSTK